MTRKETIRRNDELRCHLKGGRVLFSETIMELEPRIRGRLIYRISLVTNFHPESDHSEGVVIFAGFTVHWEIHEVEGELSLCISSNEDFD